MEQRKLCLKSINQEKDLLKTNDKNLVVSVNQPFLRTLKQIRTQNGANKQQWSKPVRQFKFMRRQVQSSRRIL